MEDVIGNLVETLCSMFFILDEDYSGLPKYLEASNHIHAVLLEELFDITNERLRDGYVDELSDRGQENSAVYAELKACKDAPDGLELERAKKAAAEVSKKALSDVFRARFYVKISGGRCV